MKYVIYVRKSTEDREDRQVLSIESQIEEVQKKFPEVEVVEIIRESKSAYKPYNRPEFQRMVEMFQTGKVQGLMAWHPDRLSREPISGGMVMHLLDSGLIKDLKFASYHYHHSPEGKMMLAMTLSQSKYSSEKLSVDVKRGMVKKCKMGRMPTRSPVGYMPDRLAEKGDKRHVKDPERFDLVRALWDLMLKGQYSVADITREAQKMGLTTRPTKRQPASTLSKTGLHKILSNSFYAGYFEWNNEIYDAEHPAMVTREEFEKIQIIIGNRHVPRPKVNEYISSGLIKCSCGSFITGEKKTKFNSSKNQIVTYEYLRCIHQKKGSECKEKPIKLKELEDQIINYFDKLRITEKFHQWAIKNLNQFTRAEEEAQNKELDRLRREHDKCQDEINSLIRLKICAENADSSLISNEQFKIIRDEIAQKRGTINEQIARIDLRADKNHSVILEVFETAKNAITKFKNSSIKEKRILLSTIGANLVLKNNILHLEAKRGYFAIEKIGPTAIRQEEQCELEEKIYGKPKEASLIELESIWSG